MVNGLEKNGKIARPVREIPQINIIKNQEKKGYTLKDFYDNFILNSKGRTPEIQWTNNYNADKRRYQETIELLRRSGTLINMFYNSKAWGACKKGVLARDGDKCVYCGKPTNIVHHRSSATFFPEICLDPENLISVCKKHHDEINKKED